MYGRKTNGELRQAELEEARLGFIQLLRRKRFSSQFIASHGDELFATAALEYSRKIAEGFEIESPAGWLIICAWRRTKSLLEAQGRAAHIVSTDKADAIGDEQGQSPEEAALDEDRFRKVREAVQQLSVEERQLLELSYFEDMAVREVARRLHWHPSKAQRRHEAARQRLHELLGVESLDELEIIVGLAAYVSLVEHSPPHLTAGIEALAETLSRAVAHGWARAQDLARRLPLNGGTEPSVTAALSSNAGRAVGACATAALACIASGVVGPGVGGVNLLGEGGHRIGPVRPSHVAAAQPVAPLKPPSSSAPSRTAAPAPTTSSPPARRSRDVSPSGSQSEQRTRRATRAVRSQSLESAAGSTSETQSTPVEAAPTAETSAPAAAESSASSAGSTPTQIASEQFGP